MMPNPSQPKIKASTVIRNIGQLVTVAQHPIPGATGPLQVISDTALAIEHGNIVWIGHDDDAEPMFQRHTGAHPGDDEAPTPHDITIVDAQEAVITPGLVDSHTHLLFAADRAEEFHQRRAAASYAELLVQPCNDANASQALQLDEPKASCDSSVSNCLRWRYSQQGCKELLLAQGRGILTTMNATRNADTTTLIAATFGLQQRV